MTSPDLYTWVGLPLMVFCARVLDVSLGTLRIIFISRGRKRLAPLLGFIEVFIWIAVVSQIVSGAHNLLAYLAYAAGFAAGNFVGLWIEEHLAIGALILRIIVPGGDEQLILRLRQAGYGVTTFDGEGANGCVTMIFTIVRRRDLPQALEIIHQSHPHVFLSVEDVRTTEQGVFPAAFNPRIGALFGRKFK